MSGLKKQPEVEFGLKLAIAIFNPVRVEGDTVGPRGFIGDFILREGESIARLWVENERGALGRGVARQEGSRRGHEGLHSYIECRRLAIVQLNDAGHSGNKIASNLVLPRSTVYRVIGEHSKRGTVSRRKGSGRSRSTTMSEDGHIILAVKRDRRDLSKEISDKLLPVEVPDKKVRRRIGRLTDLKFCCKIRKPFIRATNRMRRVRWCMDRLHYTIDQWGNFL